MIESSFEDFSISENDDMTPDYNSVVEVSKDARDSLFTILVDSNEQKPYTFTSIIGDSKSDYAPINVKTVRKRLKVGDYSILGMESIVIERKSKEDLFSSVANGMKRENFLDRLQKMQSKLRFGAIVIESSIEDIYENPPSHSSLNPKSVYRTSLSWAIQFPLVHWVWCKDREFAEQVTYRLLEKFYVHETDNKYKHHNKPIDQNIDAYQLGVVSRMNANEIEAPYPPDHELRRAWNRGWNFYSTHFLDGNLGVVYEFGKMPDKAEAKRSPKKKLKPAPDNRILLAGQADLNFHSSFQEVEADITRVFESSLKTKKRK